MKHNAGPTFCHYHMAFEQLAVDAAAGIDMFPSRLRRLFAAYPCH